MRIYKITMLVICIYCNMAFADSTLKDHQNIEKDQPKEIFDKKNEFEDAGIEEYDTMFQSINTPRKGLDKNNINKIQDTFSRQTQLKVKIDDDNNTLSNEVLDLNAIFNNKAKINNKWVNIGEIIGDYTLKKIKTSSIILTNKENSLELNITKGKNNVDIEIK
ncbi:hypothetical protein CDOMC_1081 [Campylobacter sp. RM16192]|nr:hypothetical protein CDOMC_1081 [Campylobacter sp. RM16192]